VEAVGAKAAAVVGDVRKEEDCQAGDRHRRADLRGIDIVINNASAIATEPTESLSAKSSS
jgi:NAD(P)-dependent dehydrogenase (short-subunit alcohol dehydrogenase family)